MKRNIDDFDGMKDFIISIVTVIAWVLIGTIIAVGYLTIKTEGESIVLTFISTIFTALSSLGILATIGVYLAQDRVRRVNEHKELISYLNVYANEFHENTVDIMNRIDTLFDKLKFIYGLNFTEDTTELTIKIAELDKKNRKIEVYIPSISGYSNNINLSKIYQMDNLLFEQITKEESYIESIIKDFNELRFEAAKGINASNFIISCYLGDIRETNNKLRNEINTNKFV